MDLAQHLLLGFETAMSLQNLTYCMLGVLLGTLIGILPGVGPVATIAMLMPITYSVPAISGIIMLAGIYYGAAYGGSTTAILMALPGEASSVVTVLDGHQMAKRGRAGAALAIAAISSFLGGCVATAVICAFAPMLANVALNFGSVEYFSLMTLGLVGAIVLASGSLLKAIGMVLLGVLLGIIGLDVNTGVPRFSLGILELQSGLNFAAVAMGVFGFSEIMNNLERRAEGKGKTLEIGSLYPNPKELKQALPAAARGSIIGSFLGILPGGGAILSSFASYTVEKKLSKEPKMFGQGHPAGLAGPEAANNAGSQSSFIPLLTLGIPGNAVTALLLGALMIHNILPGPLIITEHPDLFWGVVVSMLIGNVMLVILNLPLVGLWVRLLRIPYRILYPIILVLCTVGIYTLDSNVFLIYVAAAFGVMGYIWSKIGCEGAPLLLGLILGPMMEQNFRRALLLSRGDYTTFITSPMSLAMLLAAAVLLASVLLPTIRKKRDNAFVGEET